MKIVSILLSRVALFVLVALVSGTFLAAGAQFLDQGALTGVVQDASGAAIPGAEVTLTNPETSFTQTTKSNASGEYVFSPIKIGTYALTVKAQGFAQTTQKNIAVNIGQRADVNITLQAGAVSETVTVTTAPPLLQTQDSTVGTALNTQEINDTPLNGRNVVYLAQLTAGTTPAHGSRANGTGDFDANGARAEQNNFLLDGMDNNAVTPDYLGGTSYLINPAPDALQEFKVTTADYSAEFGHSAGAVVIASIKSGTNQIHGDAWEFFRNSYLNAHDWTALPNTRNPKYIENQFGASLGLPIIKDHLFLFGDAQANRIRYDQPENPISVPTAAERTGDFSELLVASDLSNGVAIPIYQPGNNGTQISCPARAASAAVPDPNGLNILCTNQIDTVAQNILNMYPLPNTGAPHQLYNNYVAPLAQPLNVFQWDARMDYDLRAADQAFARFSYVNSRGQNAAPLGPILDGGGGNGSLNVSGSQIEYANNFLFGETHVFSPKLVNQFRFGYVYAHYDILNPGYNTSDAAALGFGGIPPGALNGGLPTTTISGGGGIQSFGAHGYRAEIEYSNEYQILDNVTWNLGNHAVSLGFSFQSVRSYVYEPPTSHPSYTYNGTLTSNFSKSNTGSGVADFLLDQQYSGSVGPIATFNDDQNPIAGYAEDDWKVTKRLTLNLGVRYEYFQPYKEMAGRQASFYPTHIGVQSGTGVYLIPAEDEGKLSLNPAFLTALAANNITLQYDNNPQLTDPQYKNFSPRLGFAYSLDPNTVVRGGYGMFYQGQQQGGAADNLGTNYPFLFTDNQPGNSCSSGSASPTNCTSDGITLENGFSSLIAAGLTTAFSTPGLVGQDPHLKTTYAQDYNLTFEHSFTNNIAGSIAYVGSNGRHLPIGINANSTAALLPSGTSTQSYLPFPGFGGTGNVMFIGVSSYNSLQANLQKRLSNGLQFRATYTWSHSLDDAPDPLSSGTSNRDPNIIPIRQDYTNSGWDTRHRFTFNGFYHLPFGRGRRFLSHDNGIVDAFIGGWSLNTTFQIETGQPFSVGVSRPSGYSSVAGGSQYALRVGNPFAPGGTPPAAGTPNAISATTCPTKVRTKQHWYNPCAFENPLPSTNELTPIGTCPDPTVACEPSKYPYPSYITDEATALLFLGARSNTVYGPGYNRLDGSLFKNFTTIREQYLQFRADIFNALNTPEYASPSTSDDSVNGGLISGARAIQNATPNSRFFQLSAKYVF